ncbi:MAG: hypothetical protein R2852_07870 [Bacteroidia bacterium]
MKHISLLIGLLLISGNIIAQNDKLIPVFDQTKSFFNASYVGESEHLKFTTTGFYYIPQVHFKSISPTPKDSRKFSVELSSPVYKKNNHKLSIGGFHSYQNIEHFYYELHPQLQTQISRINLAYVYSKDHRSISLGGSLNHTSFKTDLIGLNLGLVKDRYYNTGFGISYKSSLNNFTMGIAFNDVIEHKSLIPNSSHEYTRSVRHLYINSGIDFQFGKNLVVTPSILVMKSSIYSASGVLLFTYKKHFNLGTSYEGIYDRFGLRIGYTGNKLGIHYVYSPPLSKVLPMYPGEHSFA